MLVTIVLSLINTVNAKQATGQFEITGKSITNAENQSNKSGNQTAENELQNKGFFDIIKNLFRKIFSIFKR